MKRIAVLLIAVVGFSLPAIAKQKKKIEGTCKQAVLTAEKQVAERSWTMVSNDSETDLTVLKISTMKSKSGEIVGDVAKVAIFPPALLWSHPKTGTLIFTQKGNSCLVESNGQPADTIDKEIAKESDQDKP